MREFGMAQPRSHETLVDDLRRLGVAEGEVVMVHASLRTIGPVAGGAGTVVRALDAAVGATGTLLMTIGARDDWSWVNERPEADREALLAGTEPFDAAATPADPDVGALAEVFRKAPGTVVSDHPEGRFAARGRLARALVTDVPWHDYYGAGSPLHRLVDTGGWVVRLGADINTVTLLHYAEYLADVPGKRRVRRHRLVHGADGPEVRVVECLDDSDGIVAWPGDDYFGLILADYLATGAGTRGRVGGARSERLEARSLVTFAAQWMTTHFAS